MFSEALTFLSFGLFCMYEIEVALLLNDKMREEVDFSKEELQRKKKGYKQRKRSREEKVKKLKKKEEEKK